VGYISERNRRTTFVNDEWYGRYSLRPCSSFQVICQDARRRVLCITTPSGGHLLFTRTVTDAFGWQCHHHNGCWGFVQRI
jgi:hypothetical protein